MLISIALILLLGMFTGWACKKLKLPSLLGMIFTGIILGPYMLNFIDSSILDISPDLRRIALIIILTRAGLSLNINDLKKVGRPAILMCFVPATFELIGMIFLAPRLLGVNALEAAIMGAVVGAVSPAVIVSKMIKLIDEGYGTKKGIPQMILAGASVDDVFVIVLFTAFTGLADGKSVSIISFINIPISIILGMLLGIFIGTILAEYFERVHIRDTVKVLIILSISFILITAEDNINFPITFSALIAIMFIGIAFKKHRVIVSERLSLKFNKLWVCAEIILFVLVGATVDINYAFKAGTIAIGLSCGNIVLTVAVLSIIISAPLGAFFIDMTYKKLLSCPK